METKTMSWFRSDYVPIAITPNSLRINARGFFFMNAVFMEIMLAIDIIWSCTSTFDCRSFWPTISYIATFRGHDRLLNFSTSYYMVVLFLFLMTTMTNYAEHCSRWINRIMLFLGITVCCLLPSISVLDETNNFQFVTTEKIHLKLMGTLISAGALWIYLSLRIMNSMKFPKREEEWHDFLIKYIVFGHVMAIFTAFEWFYVNTSNKHWWINENVEALCEWTVVTMCVFGPFFYTLTFPNCSIAITANEDELESK